MMSCQQTGSRDFVGSVLQLAPVIALIVGAAWSVFVLDSLTKEALQIEELRHKVELLRRTVERAPSLEIKMDVMAVGSTRKNDAYIIAYVSMHNSGTTTLEIKPSGNPLAIRIIEEVGSVPPLLGTLPMREYGGSIDEPNELLLGPNSGEQVSFIYGVSRSGIYILVFEIPVSSISDAQGEDKTEQGRWSVQRFVRVD